MIDIESVKTYLRNTLAQSPEFSSQPDAAKVMGIDTFGWNEPSLDFNVHEVGGGLTKVRMTLQIEEIRFTRPAEAEPVDVRAQELWDIVNGWYSDVALAFNHCAQVMCSTNAPLTEDARFLVAAGLHHLQLSETISAAPMDATWAHSVDIAHDALLYLNDGFAENAADSEYLAEWLEKFGSVGTYAETAKLALLATSRRRPS